MKSTNPLVAAAEPACLAISHWFAARRQRPSDVRKGICVDDQEISACEGSPGSFYLQGH